ncbi:MAG TPA: phosphohydrolase [Cytophagales bacterium]|jgi:2-amino-1-hydroxyethylphosphonate dioxygenase (glycine-forming)|nr:phosphohydrolase [Cytophagales bacterium]
MNNPKEIASEIIALYNNYGNADYIGEPVSQIEHMSQSAQLAIDGGFDDELILAAFFHDIGHICIQTITYETMGDFGVKSHEQIGADFLRSRGFSERIARLVENHVNAKRYLTFKLPEYFNSLSEASKRTLEYQGGRMSEHEAEEFENNPLFEHSLLLRRWDEQAKEMNVPVINLKIIENKIEMALQQSS